MHRRRWLDRVRRGLACQSKHAPRVSEGTVMSRPISAPPSKRAPNRFPVGARFIEPASTSTLLAAIDPIARRHHRFRVRSVVDQSTVPSDHNHARTTAQKTPQVRVAGPTNFGVPVTQPPQVPPAPTSCDRFAPHTRNCVQPPQRHAYPHPSQGWASGARRAVLSLVSPSTPDASEETARVMVRGMSDMASNVVPSGFFVGARFVALGMRYA